MTAADRERCGDDRPRDLYQTAADQVADAFHVIHDARNQNAALVGVIVGDGKPADMFLHAAAQFRDEALPLFGKQLGERERSDALNHGSQQNGENQRLK